MSNTVLELLRLIITYHCSNKKLKNGLIFSDYAVKILPQKNKEEIEVFLKKLIENKCKNAGKQNKLKEVPP